MDVATPGDLLPAVESVAGTIGQLLNLMLGDKSGSLALGQNETKSFDDDNADDPCVEIPLIDQVNADKAGVVEYETDVGDKSKSQMT